MDELKEKIKAIVDFVETLPEPYRLKSFDALLAAAQPAATAARPPPEPATPAADERGEFVIPAKVRAFLARNKLSDKDLHNMAIHDGAEIHFIHEPRGVPNATAQIQWSLLLALKAALQGGDFAVDPEAVRSICVAKGVYDAGNFVSTFKKPGNARYFQQPPKPQGEAVKLSQAGEEKLAELLRRLPAGTVE
jgi:hypothetical protein